MIAHSLAVARESGIFDRIHVSTDDPRIAEMAEALGFPVEFMRPATLADDRTPLLPVLKHVVETYQARGSSFDSVCLLTACAPLIDADDIRSACELFERFGRSRAVISVTPYGAPIEWAYRREESGKLVPVQPGMFSIRSQDLQPAWHDSGTIYFFPLADILRGSVADDSSFLGAALPRARAVDIDTADDWELAERLQRGTSAAIELAQGDRRLRALKPAVTLQPATGTPSLRPLRPVDVTDAYVAGLNDPELTYFLTIARTIRHSMETQREFVQRNWEDPAGVLFGIYRSGELRGTLRLHDIDWAARTGFVGVFLFDRRVWGQGIGSAALVEIIAFARDILGLRSLTAGIYDANEASLKLFQKAGFRRLPDTGWASDRGPAYYWSLELAGCGRA